MTEHIENLMRLSEQMAKTQAVPYNKFVSVFRINGQPIIPPLMTTEKRRQMAKLREKAMKLEGFYEDRRRQHAFVEGMRLDLEDNTEEDVSAVTPRSPSTNSLSERSQKQFEEKQKADSQACELLVTMMKNVEIDTQMVKDQIVQQVQTEEKASRLNKLQLSQTLVYDNSTNEIIMPLNEYEENDLVVQPTMQLNTPYNEKGAEEEINNNNTGDEHLLDHNAVSTCTDKNTISPALTRIPSISINPPTPMVDERSLTEALNYAESIDDSDTAIDMPNYTSSSSSIQVRIKGGCDVTQIDCAYFECSGAIEPEHQSTSNHDTTGMRRSATSPALKQNINGQSIAVKLPTKGSMNPNVEDIASITRSNSFTVESPSKALIDHMKQQEQTQPMQEPVKGHLSRQHLACRSSPRQSTATLDTVESRAKRVTKSETKSKTRIASKSSSCGLPNLHQKLFKTKRSPYDSRLSKAAGPVNNSISKTTKKNLPAKSSSASPTSGQKKKPLVTPTPSPSFTSSFAPSTLIDGENGNTQGNMLTVVANQVLGDIEAAHREKFLKLIAEQAAEQQRLQLAFEEQQRHLLEQLSRELTNAQLHVQNQTSDTSIDASNTARSCSSVSTVSTVSLCSSILSPKNTRNNTAVPDMQEHVIRNMSAKSVAGNNDTGYSPRRRLFDNESQPATPSSACGDATYRTSSPNRKSKKLVKIAEESFKADLERDAAATKINAYARGFLVRRLFQTEQIQRIVQTIRDTLIFVINLHMETRDNPKEAYTAANIRLKARLLQQLSSATRTLHLVFFQTTIKERMEIIARDRRRIKTKLLTNNMRRSSPRIVGST